MREEGEKWEGERREEIQKLSEGGGQRRREKATLQEAFRQARA